MQGGRRAKDLKKAKSRAKEAAQEARPVVLSAVRTILQVMRTVYAIAVRMIPQVLRVARELAATGIRFADAVRREAPRLWRRAQRKRKGR